MIVIESYFLTLTVETIDNNNGWNSQAPTQPTHSQIKNTPAPLGRDFSTLMQRKNTEKQLQNLKPFPKGISGNPAGRPKKALLSDALRRQLAIAAPGMPEKTQAEAIAAALISEAIAGNIAAAREIGDRTEGRPMQSIGVDLQINDWQTEAQKYGLSETDVINEARLLIESALESSGE
jgi:hypothetical protein